MVGSVEEMVEMGRYLWIQFSTICMLNFMASPPVLSDIYNYNGKDGFWQDWRVIDLF